MMEKLEGDNIDERVGILDRNVVGPNGEAHPDVGF